jgi:thiamine pyrophosphokinase
LIIGGIGGRFDHSFVNVHLLTLGNISMQSSLEFMYVLQPGEHTIENTHKYISFFAMDTVTNLSLYGFTYELKDITLKQGDPLCISNRGSGVVTFETGALLVIHQNE